MLGKGVANGRLAVRYRLCRDSDADIVADCLIFSPLPAEKAHFRRFSLCAKRVRHQKIFVLAGKISQRDCN